MVPGTIFRKHNFSGGQLPDCLRDRFPNKLVDVSVLVLAFTIRLVYILQLKSTIFFSHFILDEAFYENWAKYITSGHWLPQKVFDALPLYPYLLGISYKLFGHNLLIPRLIGIFIGSLSCLLVYKIAKKLFDRPAAIISALIAALYGPFIFYSGIIASETTAVFLYLLALWIVLKISDKPTFIRFFAFGITVGLAALTKAGILLYVPVLLIWLVATAADKKRAIAGSTITLLGIAVLILPITIRNYIISKDIVFLTSHSGLNFYIGNNEYADGTFKPPQWARSNIEGLSCDAKTIAEKKAGVALGESGVSRFYYTKAAGFIKQHPFRFFRLLGRKFFLFLNSQELYDVAHYQVYKEYIPLLRFPFITFLIIGPLALTGVFVAIRRWKKVLPLYLFVLTYTVSILIYFVNSRYRLPFVATIIIFAGFFISWLFDRIRQRKYMLLTMALCLYLMSFIFSKLPTDIKTLSTGYSNLGNIYMDAGQLDDAVGAFNKAIIYDDSDPKPYNDIGYIRIVQDKLEEAEKFLHKSLSNNREYPFAHINLGLLYDKKQDLESAEKEYKEAIRLNPNIPEAHNNLANIYEKTDRRQPAIDEYKKALELDPANAKTHYNLGVVYGRAGELEKAKEEFEEAAHLDPKFSPAQEALRYFRDGF